MNFTCRVLKFTLDGNFFRFLYEPRW
jgi:hypothetical protein